MIRKLTKSETEALLTELAENRSCDFGCECVFCREFERGVQSGKHEAKKELVAELYVFVRGLK